MHEGLNLQGNVTRQEGSSICCPPYWSYPQICLGFCLHALCPALASCLPTHFVYYRISALVWRSVTGCAPSFLTDLVSRRTLRSRFQIWFAAEPFVLRLVASS